MTVAHLTAALLDPDFYAGDPFPLYRRLRAEAPLVRNEDRGMWIASKHADVIAISSDPATYCSARGILADEIGVDYPTPPTMMHTDPPQHTRYRGVVAPRFRPSAVRRLDGAVRMQARALLDDLSTTPAVDIVAGFAAPLPIRVIAELLGVPADDWRQLFEWSEAMIPGALDLPDGQIRSLQGECYAYLLALTKERRDAPQEDLVSELTQRGLSDDELLMFLVQLLVAGNETARNMISGGLLALAERPQQWQRLRADRTFVTRAVEEMLRWTTPVISFMRTATRDVELRGRLIRSGEPILMLYASANRDEEVFGADAGEFDVARHPNPHLSFGIGPHFCLGAHLARLEGRIVLEEMLDRYSSIAVGGAVVRTRSSVIAGLHSVPLQLS